MSTLFISEFTANSQRDFGRAKMPSNVDQTVTIGATSAQSSAFQASTNLIRVVADATCAIAIGANPTATATNLFLPANVVEYFEVQPGNKIAVITAT